MAAQPIFAHFDHVDEFWGAEGASAYMVEAVSPLLVTRVRLVKVDVLPPETDPAFAGVATTTLTAAQFAAQRVALQEPVLQAAPTAVTPPYTPVARCYALGGGATDWFMNSPGKVQKISSTKLSNKLGQESTIDVTLTGGQRINVAAGSVICLMLQRNNPALEDAYDFELFMDEG